jgi:hypothetical protein
LGRSRAFSMDVIQTKHPVRYKRFCLKNASFIHKKPRARRGHEIHRHTE